jgi:putative addiction module component (TIGR02574 family)
MNKAKSLLAELLKLSPAERIQLAQDLWDSVAASPERCPH